MKIKQSGSHVDQMLRQTRSHHVNLSSIADNKANMMLTIASILVPLSIRFLYDPRSQLAAMTMILFCVLTILFAAYAAMPKIKQKKNANAPIDLNDPSFNILFFGSFIQMDYSDFTNAMEEVMMDHNNVYESQIREIYTMGQYLAQKKYRFVRLAYLSFIAGVILSSSIFILSSYS